MIKLNGVSVVYPAGNHALDNVSFSIKEGEFAFIVGASGSGKTTLIKLLLREMLPTEGTVCVNNRDYSSLKRKEIPLVRRNIGVVFQDFRLLKDRTVFENVAFAQRVIEKSNKEINQRVPEILSMVGLGNKLDCYPKELSGGEQQRVALARALVNRPRVLLADEPTGNLDPKNSIEIMKLLEKANAMGTTVVVVTHSKEIVDAMQKRVITLKHGIKISDEQEGGYKYE